MSTHIITLPCRLLQGLIVVTNDDGDWIVDTGSPVSIGDIATTRFGHVNVPLNSDAFGLTCDELRSLFKAPVAGLIGMDVLNRYGLFDPENGQAVLSDVPLRQMDDLNDWHEIPLTFRYHMGMVDVSVDGVQTQAIFDTGANLSYWQRGFRPDWPQGGSYDDFHPSLGEFTTDTAVAPVRVTGTPDWAGPLRVGHLPGLIGAVVDQLGGGLIGLDLLRGGPLMIAYPQNKIFVRRL